MQSTLLPGVVRVDVHSDPSKQSAYMPVIDGISTCAEEYKPTEEWSNNICADFSELRSVIFDFHHIVLFLLKNVICYYVIIIKEISQMSLNLETRERKCKVPPMRDRINWEVFCFGNGGLSCEQHQNLDVDMSCECDEDDSYDSNNENIEQKQEQEGQSLSERKKNLLDQLAAEDKSGLCTLDNIFIRMGC